LGEKFPDIEVTDPTWPNQQKKDPDPSLDCRDLFHQIENLLKVYQWSDGQAKQWAL